MAITPQEQSNIIALTVALFDAPPGAQYLAELTAVFEQNNNSYEALTNFIVNTPAFNAQYAGAQSLDDQIFIALQNLGLSPGSAAFEEASDIFAQRAAEGASAAQILIEAGEYLLSGNVAPAYADIAAKFANKLNVATYYSVELGLSNDNIAELKGLLFTVDENPLSVAAVRAGLDSEGGITYSIGQAISIALSTDRALPDVYSISANSSLFWGADTIANLNGVLASVTDVIENAFNGESLSLNDLFSWEVNDTAEAIISGLESAAVTGAGVVNVSDAPVSFEQYTALRGLESLDADALEVGLTLAQGLEILGSEETVGEDDEVIPALELPATYSIELVDSPVDLGELSLVELEALQEQVDALVDGALNSEAIDAAEVTLQSQVSWTLQDSAASILAALDSVAVTSASAIVLTDTTISQAQFDALSELNSFNLGDTIVSETLTLAQALASLSNNVPLPTNYTIDPADATDEVEVSVAEAQAALADVQDIFAGALNTQQLSVADLFNWSVVDTATAVLGAAGTPAITGAATVSVNNATLTQTQYNSLLENVPNFVLSEATAVNLTLPAAFALATSEDADALPANYSIDVDGAVLDAGTVSVEDAQNAYAIVEDILENAANAEDLTLADLFIWQVEDNAQAIIDALESPAITEAGSVTITDEQITQGQLEQLETLGNFTLGDDDVEVVGVTFATQTTLATEASDGTPGEYAFTTETIPEVGNATLLRITLGDDEVIEVGLSGATDGDAIVTALNGDTAFDDAGFEASYETSNARLVITDSQARVLNADNFELLSGGVPEAPSEFTAQLLQGTLVNTNTLNITIGGEAYIIRGIDGGDTPDGDSVASDIQLKLREAVGDNDISVSFDNSTLTIKDNQRRDISDLTVRNVPESSVSFDLTEVDLTDDAPATLSFTLDGETVTVDIALDNDGTTIDVTALEGVTAEFDNDVLTITDALGRNFSAAELLDAGDPSEPSIYNITNITDSAVEAADAFSLTVGDSVLERFDISGIKEIGDDTSGLIELLQGEFSITASYDPENNTLSLESDSGAEFSGLFIGAAADEASSVTVSGLTDAYLAGLESLSLDIGATTLEVEGLTLEENTDTLLKQLEFAIDNALANDNSAWAGVSVAINEDTRTLTVTDARGRELGEPTVMAQTLPAIVANGLTDSSINFDLRYISFDYGEEELYELTLVDGQVKTQQALLNVLNGDTEGELPTGFIASFIDNTLVIEAPEGTVLANPAFLTAEEDGFEVVSESNLQVVETLISTEVSNAVLPEAGLPGIALELEQEGVPAGLNAQEVAAPSFTNSEGTEGNIFGTEFEPGNEEGAGAEPVGEFSVLVQGEAATQAEPWMATITLESAEEALLEDYTFTLTLTESDADEPSIATFSVSADAGATLAEVAELLAAAVNAEEGDFAGMFTAAWDEDSASFSLVAANEDGVNFDLETDATVIGVYDPGM